MRTPCPLLAQLELSLIGGLSGYGAGYDAFLVDIDGLDLGLSVMLSEGLFSGSLSRSLHDIILIFFCLLSGPRLSCARPSEEHEQPPPL